MCIDSEKHLWYWGPRSTAVAASKHHQALWHKAVTISGITWEGLNPRSPPQLLAGGRCLAAHQHQLPLLVLAPRVLHLQASLSGGVEAGVCV